LPYRTSPYGTGQPQRIDSELARRAIRRVFEQEGYKLQPSYHYMHDHVAFIADGFDVAKKVGFVFADWKNLDTDAVISWMDFRKPDVQIALIRREFEALDPTDAAKLDEYLGSQGSEQLNREIATARAIEDPEARKTAIAAALQKAASRQIHGLEQEARGTTESGDDLVELLGRYNVVGAEVEKAKAIADPKARRRVLSELVERAQKRRISLAEMQRLENRKPSDKNFVAVISDFDDRFNVSSWGDEWESMATLRSIPDPVKRNAALVAAQEQAARKALDRLEQSVREYIAWARSQGAQ
jgi:hypothetical protein